MTKMCLKFIYTLLQKDLMIFTEEFCAMLLYNEDYIKAIVAISMEIILFIEDIEEITFNRIPEFLGLDVYDLWKIMNPIQLRSIVFHKEIKDHLEEVEEQLLSFLIWRNPRKALSLHCCCGFQQALIPRGRRLQLSTGAFFMHQFQMLNYSKIAVTASFSAFYFQISFAVSK